METTTSERIPAQAALDELSAAAQTPQDKVQVERWQAEIDQQRQDALQNLGNSPKELVQLPDGSVVTKDEVASSQARGEEASGAYNNGRRG